MYVDPSRPLGIAGTLARYCQGEDQELLDAQQRLVTYQNLITAGRIALNWPALADLERGVLEAALKAGYRMAMRDAKTALDRL